MTSPTKLELEGTLGEHPLAELLAEINEAKLSGSFRLASDQHKINIYLDRGEIVYAVSNSRRHRLFDILLRTNKIAKQQLANIENIGNDLEFGQELISLGIINEADLNNICSQQVAEIIRAGLSWKDGDWFYSSLLRAREGIRFEVNIRKLLLKHARGLAPEVILSRFGSEAEAFGLQPTSPAHPDIQSHEAFILSRFEKSFLDLAQIDAISGLSDRITRQALYTLWLGGFLFRRNWNPVFTESKIAAILAAKLKLKEGVEPLEQAPPVKPAEAKPEIPVEMPETPEEEPVDEEQQLQDYLEKIENAANLYEILNLTQDAGTSDIKRSYFSQAKKYHPDLFHNQADTELHKRIQSAFTEIAHAYETLKEPKSRDLYNYKMRKEIEKMKKQQAAGATAEEINQDHLAERAAENFESGLNLLMKGEAGDAIPFFARAVHFAEGNARYHAYYGKALSSSQKHLHKAEGELQHAVRIEPDNMTYRLMLAELFAHIGLFKRAEGELKRLLAMAPDDTEALALLDSLQKK